MTSAASSITASPEIRETLREILNTRFKEPEVTMFCDCCKDPPVCSDEELDSIVGGILGTDLEKLHGFQSYTPDPSATQRYLFDEGMLGHTKNKATIAHYSDLDEEELRNAAFDA